ncbi:MAG: hypothetical protein EBS06_06190 [Proteobacteria bacterium]|nr:hypothetical protein [Pseudomonadota bacterium]
MLNKRQTSKSQLKYCKGNGKFSFAILPLRQKVQRIYRQSFCSNSAEKNFVLQQLGRGWINF